LKILDVPDAKGGGHGFKVYKETVGKGIGNSIRLGADRGCLGIKEYHTNSFIPVKPGKNRQLNRREKAYTKRLSRGRVVIGHINAKKGRP
jgi:hypothetical protein